MGRESTHDWEVWVRNPNDGRIEHFLDKVVFTLHHTFENSVRKVTKPPFMVQEQGYGSFPILIDLYFKAPKGSNLDKTRVVYELVLQPQKNPLEPDYKREYSLRRLEKMQFPTKDEDFKRRLLKGGARMVEVAKPGDKSSGREKDRSKDKDKDKERRERDREKDRKEKRDSDKYREREKEKQREKERMKEKLEEKPKPIKPKSDFTELFGTPIKKEAKKEKEEKSIKKEKDIKKEDIKKEKTSSTSSLSKEKDDSSTKISPKKEK